MKGHLGPLTLMLAAVFALEGFCLFHAIGARVCYEGQQPDPNAPDQYGWVMTEKNPADCTEVQLAGVNVGQYAAVQSGRDAVVSGGESASTEPPTVDQEECGMYLGMKDGGIPDLAITASSRWFKSNTRGPFICQASHGRLNYLGTSDGVVGGWCAGTKNVSEWLQVDLGRPLQVEGVIIQGSVDPLEKWFEWVTKYQVQYSDDQTTWQYVMQSGQTHAQTFQGNTDQTTPVTSLFDQPIRARYIRIVPTAFNCWPSMRMELIGCKSA